MRLITTSVPGAQKRRPLWHKTGVGESLSIRPGAQLGFSLCWSSVSYSGQGLSLFLSPISQVKKKRPRVESGTRVHTAGNLEAGLRIMA